MFTKIFGILGVAMVAVSFVACGDNDNSQQIKTLQTQVAELKAQLGNTRNGLDRVSGYVDTEAVFVTSNGIPTNNPNPWSAFPSEIFDSKLEMAQHYLALGQTENAKGLLESAVSDLGLNACNNVGPSKYVLSRGRGVPLELQRLGADLAPLFVFSVDPKTGYTVINYNPPVC